MEYVEGADFAALLSNTKLHERLHIISQVANGLAFAHGRGLMHRDLKPQNVLVSVHGDGKVADFGLGRAVEEESRLTRVGSTVGSAHYMAPEQGIGKAADRRADLYSLGVMLYQCATGRLPFVGRTQELISQHLRVKPKPPRRLDGSIPEELEALILRSLEKNPNKRPQSAESVRSELEQLHRAYWPIISVDELRAAIGASASLAATRMKSNSDQIVVASPGKSPSRVAGQSSKLTVHCTNCGRVLRIKAADSTKLLGCPICDKTFRAPQPQVQKSPAKTNHTHAPPKVERNPLVEALAEEAAATPATAVLSPRSNHIHRKSRKVTISVGQLTTAAVCLTALTLGGISLYMAWPSDARSDAPPKTTTASTNPVPPIRPPVHETPKAT
ncbi:MAG: serine/threonine protein kinase, partial [Planctomycetes bacterium]|nr:serine/threonine protein kinase [Planctomycetota bacterium]